MYSTHLNITFTLQKRAPLLFSPFCFHIDKTFRQTRQNKRKNIYLKGFSFCWVLREKVNRKQFQEYSSYVYIGTDSILGGDLQVKKLFAYQTNPAGIT